MGWNLLWLCCVIFIKPNKQIQAQVNNQKTSTRSEIRSNLTTSSSGRRHLLFFDVFIANFEHFTPYSSVYIVEFEQIAGKLCCGTQRCHRPTVVIVTTSYHNISQLLLVFLQFVDFEHKFISWVAYFYISIAFRLKWKKKLKTSH